MILHLTLRGFSSPHTLLKYHIFKHLTGQGESDSDVLPEHRSHARYDTFFLTHVDVLR
jgi:hypothetical protein